MAANSTSTTALFSKKFNNLFVKNFPKANFTSEELKVSRQSLVFSDHKYLTRPYSSHSVRSSVPKSSAVPAMATTSMRMVTPSQPRRRRQTPAEAMVSSASPIAKMPGKPSNTSTRSKTSQV